MTTVEAVEAAVAAPDRRHESVPRAARVVSDEAVATTAVAASAPGEVTGRVVVTVRDGVTVAPPGETAAVGATGRVVTGAVGVVRRRLRRRPAWPR